MKRILLATAIVATLSGCGSVNNVLAEKTKTVEYYRIFDVTTTSDRNTVADAASNGLGKHINTATEARPIPTFTEAPESPGRFKLINPLEGTKMAGWAAVGGSIGFRMATCDGAVWTAKAEREVENSDTLKLTVCLWEYKGGYHLDSYAVFQKKEGGVMQLSRAMASAVVGSPEEWTEKTFVDIVKEIQKETGAKITYLEGYPKIEGTPWLD
jgi:hypothetical protein